MLIVNFDSFPLILTDQLNLRRITRDDAAALFALRSNNQVMQFIDRPMAQNIEDALDLVEKIEISLMLNDGITWGIALKTEHKLIGTIGFWRLDKANYRAEIGYMLLPEFQGSGLMQEAISRVIQYGFHSMNLHSIEANVNPSNIASKKLLEKNDFVKEAYFKENYYYNGKFLDSLIYSLVKS